MKYHYIIKKLRSYLLQLLESVRKVLINIWKTDTVPVSEEPQASSQDEGCDAVLPALEEGVGPADCLSQADPVVRQPPRRTVRGIRTPRIIEPESSYSRSPEDGVRETIPKSPSRERVKTPLNPKPARKKKERKASSAEIQLATAITGIDAALNDHARPRKSSAERKSKVGELLERALTDASFFPPCRDWPVLDLCIYGAEFDSDDEEDTVNYVQLFPTRRWLDDLARPLNFHVLKAPTSNDWKAAHALGMVQQPVQSLRGLAIRIKPYEKAEIGRRVRNSEFREQKYAQPYNKAINYHGLEAVNMRIFGDPNYFSKHGVYTMRLAVSKHEAFALADSGVVLDLEKVDADGLKSQSDLVRDRIHLSCGMQLMAESTWRVILQYEENRPRISFMASAEIVKELLSLRRCSDKVKKQRMLHIVTAHTRRVREEKEVDVMRHYRGSTETLWKGCTMRIVPPIRETDLMEKMTDKVAEIRKLTETIQPSKISV